MIFFVVFWDIKGRDIDPTVPGPRTEPQFLTERAIKSSLSQFPINVSSARRVTNPADVPGPPFPGESLGWSWLRSRLGRGCNPFREQSWGSV